MAHASQSICGGETSGGTSDDEEVEWDRCLVRLVWDCRNHGQGGEKGSEEKVGRTCGNIYAVYIRIRWSACALLNVRPAELEYGRKEIEEKVLRDGDAED